MGSVWEMNIKMPFFTALKGDLRTDVLIIGGGLAGLLCAWKLKEDGVDCVLIEQDRILSGVSGRTTAKITSQHGLIYQKLLAGMGEERAGLYWQAHEEALAAYRKLAEKADFGFETQSSILYQRVGTERVDAELEACRRLGIPARWDNAASLPFAVAGAVAFDKQAQFHPLKFGSYIASGLNIYEKTKALAFFGNRVQTSGGMVTAEKIIVTTHFPMLNKHGSYFLKLYQQRSYVIALEQTQPVEGMYLDCEENGLSVRSAGPWLLLGGGGHRTGKQGIGWQLPVATAEKYYPQARITERWATQDCMTLDAMPYIGQYSRNTSRLFVATGFNKWGMSSSMLAAGILADLIRGRENPYAELFSPSRSMMHKQLLTNGVDAAVNLLRPSVPRCPHLGCALRWNQEEHSWDCPCHGSRFDSRGKVLNNPATDDLKHTQNGF